MTRLPILNCCEVINFQNSLDFLAYSALCSLQVSVAEWLTHLTEV